MAPLVGPSGKLHACEYGILMPFVLVVLFVGDCRGGEDAHDAGECAGARVDSTFSRATAEPVSWEYDHSDHVGA